MTNHRKLLCTGLVAGMLGVSVAQAQEEDSSAAFEARMSELGAAMGMAASGSNVTENADGSVSANIGIEHMRMLVVRQNEDGSMSFGHVGDGGDYQDFSKAHHQHGPAEK